MPCLRLPSLNMTYSRPSYALPKSPIISEHQRFVCFRVRGFLVHLRMAAAAVDWLVGLDIQLVEILSDGGL